jgi:hypothetical protein
MTPSTRIPWTTEVAVNGGSISFDVVSLRNHPEEIERRANEVLDALRTQGDNASREVGAFNNLLPSAAQDAVAQRKKQHLERANLPESLNVPVKRSDQTPKTFAIPGVRRRVLVKPSSPDAAHAPEQNLDPATYADILRIWRDTGIQVERLPRTYAGKDEEMRRDHFIMLL